MKQPTTKQRFNDIIKSVDLLTAGFDADRKKIAESSMLNGILDCIKHLKEVHLSGGNAGKFLNELEKLCLAHVYKNAIEAMKKLNASSAEMTDKIVDPKN